MSLYLTIAGIDRARGFYIPGTGRISRSKNGRYQASFTVRDPAQLWRPAKGQAVTFGDAGTGFVGKIARFTESRDFNGSSSPIRFACSCVDVSEVFDRRLVFRRYPSGASFANIIRDIIDNVLAGEGFTTTFVNGFGAISNELIFDGRTVRECLNTIRDLSGEENWTNGYDLYSRTLGDAEAAPFDITETSANWKDLTVEHGDNSTYRNRQYVRSSVQLQSGAFVDNAVGDGFQFFFPTTYALSQAPTVTINGVTQTLYERNVDSNGLNGWYWTRDSYGISHGQYTPVPAGHAVVITYGSYSSNVISVENASEIAARAAAEGGTGIYEALEDARDINNIETAQALGAGLLDRSGALPITIKYSTLEGGLRPGMTQTVNLTKNGIVATYYVTQIESEALRANRGFPSGMTWEDFDLSWNDATQTWEEGRTYLFFRHTVTLSNGRDQGADPRRFWENLTGKIKGIDYSSVAAQVADGYHALTINANHVAIDLANGRNQILTLNQAAQVTVDNPVLTGATGLQAGDWFVLYVDQDATGGRPKPAFGTDFASDAALQEIDGTPNTRSTYQFTWHGSKWALDGFRTGGAIT